jgi:oligosaccharyltransferase complex subunit alpha (ribophorin I)
MRLTDSRYLLSPYQVLIQSATFNIESEALLEYSRVDASRQNERGVKYGPYKLMPAYSFDQVTLLFKIPEPELILSSATKTVTVSHWGFLSVDEYFDLYNIGAEIKGEFSRVDFHKSGMARNCMRQITAKYPWYIQSMYFNDYIGNISTTNAVREEEVVKVDYYPRYPVCGGWKVDWSMGYKMPTKYHLSKANPEEDLYTLEIPFLHNYDVLLAENYTFEVVLPFGAVDI